MDNHVRVRLETQAGDLQELPEHDRAVPISIKESRPRPDPASATERAGTAGTTRTTRQTTFQPSVAAGESLPLMSRRGQHLAQAACVLRSVQDPTCYHRICRWPT